jgi:hypothetical protein
MESSERDEASEAPSGLPEDAPEADPLGPSDARPEGDDEPPRGGEAMPGIPTEGEPPSGG